MHIEGKDLSQGRYLFHRYLTQNGERVIVNTYKIERTTDGYEFYDSEIKMADDIRRIEFKKNKNCPVCGDEPVITELKDYEQKACNI